MQLIDLLPSVAVADCTTEPPLLKDFSNFKPIRWPSGIERLLPDR